MEDRQTMNITPEEVTVINNEVANRFEIHIGDEMAFLTYTLDGTTIAYKHTEVPPTLEGRGIAAKLATHALDYARANHLDVVPLCPYVAEYIKRHPAYEDLVAPRSQWRPFLDA
jgi:uncharacterized protein